MPVKGWIEVNHNYCKGCELCVAACPQDVLRLNMDVFTSKGYHPAYQATDACVGCGICASMCPDAAITVYRAKKG